MATRLYGISRGEKHYDVTEQVGSPTTDDIELTVDLAKVTSREEALVLIDKVKAYILEEQDNWPAT